MVVWDFFHQQYQLNVGKSTSLDPSWDMELTHLWTNTRQRYKGEVFQECFGPEKKSAPGEKEMKRLFFFKHHFQVNHLFPRHQSSYHLRFGVGCLFLVCVFSGPNTFSDGGSGCLEIQLLGVNTIRIAKWWKVPLHHNDVDVEKRNVFLYLKSPI